MITNRPAPSTANGVPAATVFSSTGTDSSGEAREKRRYEVPDAFAGLCSEMRDREVGMKSLTHTQIELDFTVMSYVGRFFCGGGLISDCLLLYFDVVRPFSICLMIIDRHIFAFCDVELEAQRKKDPSFCSEFSVIILCNRVIL